MSDSFFDKFRDFNKKMDNKFKFPISYVIIAMAILFVLQFMSLQEFSERVSYSELKAKIEAGEIAKVSISQEFVEGVARSSMQFGEAKVFVAVRINLTTPD